MEVVDFKEICNDEDVNVETCHGGSEVGKHFLGVSKTKTSWRARVRHPKLKVDVYLGCYKSPGEAAVAVRKKKAEFEQMFKSENCLNVETCKDVRQKEDVNVEYCPGGSEVVKRFPGVSKSGNKWLARVRHPTMRIDVSCGRYESPEEAALAVKRKKAEFEEFYKCDRGVNVETYEDDFDGKQQEDVEDDTCNGGSDIGKHFRGVCKSGSKWRARARHSKLKVDVYLGCYKTTEAAALVVKKKEDEFKEMIRIENRINVETHVNVETRKVDFKGTESVFKRECGGWGARIWHPKLKYNASLGSYNTREEALVAVTNKSAELWKTYGWTAMVKPDFKVNGQVLEEPEHENESLSEISDELADDLKVPAGVCELKPGKWDARIIDPVSGDRTWLGTFDTAKEAVRSLNKGKADFSTKRKRADFDGSEFLPKATSDSETGEFDGSEFLPKATPGNERAEFDGSEFWPKATLSDERAEFDGSEFRPKATPSNERAEFNGFEFGPKAAPDNERIEFDGSEVGPKATTCNERAEFDGSEFLPKGASCNERAEFDGFEVLPRVTSRNERSEFDGSEVLPKATPCNETIGFDGSEFRPIATPNNGRAKIDGSEFWPKAMPSNKRAEFVESEFGPKATASNERAEFNGPEFGPKATTINERVEFDGPEFGPKATHGDETSEFVRSEFWPEAMPGNRRAEFDGSEFWPKAAPGNGASEGHPVKLECEFDDGCLTSVLAPDNLSSVPTDDPPNHDVATRGNESADFNGSDFGPKATPSNNLAEFDGSEFGPNGTPGNEASEGRPVKLECEFDDGCLTSVLGADNLNTIAVDDQSNHEVAIVKLENSNSADMGIVNEYGQLVGEYSELDEQMGFSLLDEDADV